MSSTLHIVCFDAPAPPDYGGAIDLYYKIEALAKAGLQIKLHYFDYRLHRDLDAIKRLCSEVHTYSRKSVIRSISTGKPYIVASRINQDLINKINNDSAPILLEGIHCTGISRYINPGKKIIVRVHNNEATYYRNLALTEKSLLKKIYFKLESHLLKIYQNSLENNCRYICLSTADVEQFKRYLTNVSHIPCFIPWQEINCVPGKGEYCLYHGNLSVPENEKAAKWLATEVLPLTAGKLIVAGHKPSQHLKDILQALPQCQLVEAPDDNKLEELIRHAHINVLPSFNSTGVKLKVLHALFSGRFCLTNRAGIEGSGIEKGINVAESGSDFANSIKALLSKEFSEDDKNERMYLKMMYDNKANAAQINALL